MLQRTYINFEQTWINHIQTKYVPIQHATDTKRKLQCSCRVLHVITYTNSDQLFLPKSIRQVQKVGRVYLFSVLERCE